MIPFVLESSVQQPMAIIVTVMATPSKVQGSKKSLSVFFHLFFCLLPLSFIVHFILPMSSFFSYQLNYSLIHFAINHFIYHFSHISSAFTDSSTRVDGSGLVAYGPFG